MRGSTVLTGLSRLAMSNVAVTAAALLAPLLVLTGELTDQGPVHTGSIAPVVRPVAQRP